MPVPPTISKAECQYCKGVFSIESFINSRGYVTPGCQECKRLEKERLSKYVR